MMKSFDESSVSLADWLVSSGRVTPPSAEWKCLGFQFSWNAALTATHSL